MQNATVIIQANLQCVNLAGGEDGLHAPRDGKRDEDEDENVDHEERVHNDVKDRDQVHDVLQYSFTNQRLAD
jgi:hypothetical protein